MRKLRKEFREGGQQQGFQQQFSSASRREKILAPPSFCQEAASLSGGISKWPRPGVARRKPGESASVRRRDSMRYDS
ncbi:MAG: hypothetical protein FJX40_05220 [Alphaproteobacteria bacterium]|nr:hypothetical protein [Alphaproteobacteria bacterium]